MQWLSQLKCFFPNHHHWFVPYLVRNPHIPEAPRSTSPETSTFLCFLMNTEECPGNLCHSEKIMQEKQRRAWNTSLTWKRPNWFQGIERDGIKIVGPGCRHGKPLMTSQKRVQGFMGAYAEKGWTEEPWHTSQWGKSSAVAKCLSSIWRSPLSIHVTQGWLFGAILSMVFGYQHVPFIK